MIVMMGLWYTSTSFGYDSYDGSIVYPSHPAMIVVMGLWYTSTSSGYDSYDGPMVYLNVIRLW